MAVLQLWNSIQFLCTSDDLLLVSTVIPETEHTQFVSFFFFFSTASETWKSHVLQSFNFYDSAVLPPLQPSNSTCSKPGTLELQVLQELSWLSSTMTGDFSCLQVTSSAQHLWYTTSLRFFIHFFFFEFEPQNFDLHLSSHRWTPTWMTVVSGDLTVVFLHATPLSPLLRYYQAPPFMITHNAYW